MYECYRPINICYIIRNQDSFLFIYINICFTYLLINYYYYIDNIFRLLILEFIAELQKLIVNKTYSFIKYLFKRKTLDFKTEISTVCFMYKLTSYLCIRNVTKWNRDTQLFFTSMISLSHVLLRLYIVRRNDDKNKFNFLS